MKRSKGGRSVASAVLGCVLIWIAAVPGIASTYTEYEPDEHTVLLDHLNGSTLGTPTNVSFEPSFPWLDQCAVFDGSAYGATGTYIQYDPVDPLSTSNGTVEAWVWLDGVTNEGMVVSQGPNPGAGSGWTFGMGFGSTPYDHFHAGAWNAFGLQSSESFPLRTWTHVAVTWGSRGAELWINGVLDDTDTSTGHPASGFGGHLIAWARSNSLTVKIDELRVSNIQRTSYPPAPAPIAEYSPDGYTVLLDHLNGSTLGTPTNVSFEPSFPWLDQCAVFDGSAYGATGTYIQYDPVDPLSTSNGTVEAWVWLDGVTNEGMVVSQGPNPGAGSGWTFGMGFGSTPYDHFHAGAWNAFGLQSSESFPLRTWTHVAVTWGSRGAELWINGVLDDTDTSTGHPASGFGGHLIAWARSNSLTVKIDELRVSNVQRPEFPTAVESASWGSIKILYR